VQKFTKFETLLKEGDPGGALYIVLEGMVRVRKMISGREDVLVTLGVGEMFGEMSLFDDSKRSADIVANSDGVLLRLSLDVMQRMVDKQPEVVVPFLVEMAKKMAGRIRADNERHKKDTILMQSRR
jgi:CRP-like cAMP-binding protein